MASSTADPDRVRENMCSNPSRRVRIIGKIRAFTDQESESLTQDTKPWITVCKPQDGAVWENRVRVSFLDQSTSRKDASYELDYCYGQGEDMNMIFSREIKPLISDIYNGANASIITFGARGSGKTYAIQGTEKNPGLAVMALTELFPKAEETEKSVSLSLCEVSQERVYDLLDPNHSEIQVLEDARGKINLKGLLQVSLKSISEFHNIYFGRSNFGKSAQKMPFEQPKRSHKVMIIYVFDNLNCKVVGKMNFVDLAGYMDARRTSTDGSTLTESTRINKSLHAVLNVIKGLNTNEIHVPYRESKLTHMLKESLGGRNHVLMLTCLNPLFCQDTIHTLSLASRSCQSTSHLSTDSTMRLTNSARLQVLSSQKTVKPTTTPRVVKKQVACGVQLSTKKGTAMSNGRKLFDNGKKVISNQAKSPKDDDSVEMLALLPESDPAMTPSRLKEASRSKPVSDSSLTLVPNNEVVFKDKSILSCSLVESHEEVDTSAHNKSNNLEVTSLVTCDKSLLEHDDATGKKTESLPKNEGGSPPLSERLREISNNLKLFCSATPLRVTVPEDVDKQHGVGFGFSDVTEPKTPPAENCTRFSEKMEITKYSSPWEVFNQRSSGMKNILVEDYLKFLNTASKEELKRLKGIGERRATYILELRGESTEPFKSLEDVEDIGLSAKQIKGMMKNVVGELFS